MKQAGCSFEDRRGYNLRKMKLKATSGFVIELFIINQVSGSITCNKCDQVTGLGTFGSSGHSRAAPPQLHERSVRGSLRVDWRRPTAGPVAHSQVALIRS